MTMELDHDLGEGTSRSTNGVGNSYACPSLLEREARAIEWPGAVKTLLNTAFEDADLEEAYSMVVQNTGDAHRPNADTVVQLVALVLEPEACLPTSRKGEDDDLLNDAYALTSHHASLRALGLLRRWLYQPGPSAILGALPRRTDAEHAPPRSRYTFIEEDETQLRPLQIMGNRVVQSEDVWQLLSKGLKDENKPRSFRMTELAEKTSYGISDASWELLSLLVEAWQLEGLYLQNNEKESLGYSPSLLSQFKAPALGGPPTDTTACVDIIIQPFKDIHLTNIRRTEHAETASHLLSLMADLASTGMIDKSAFHVTVCDALYQLRVANLQEVVVSSLPDRLPAKIDLLSFYLSKYSAPASTSFPPAPKTISSIKPFPTPSTSPPKLSSSVPPSSKTSLPSSQRVVIDIDSGSDTDDSDVVCLTPVVKKTPTKTKGSPVKAKPSAQSSPIKAKPLVQDNSFKADSLQSSPQSQDIKPDMMSLIDPLLVTPADFISKISKQIPRELVSLSTDAPKMRVPSRIAQSARPTSNGKSVTQSMVNAEMKFATIKLELARVYMAYAESKQATAVQSDWRSSKDRLLSNGIRGYRHLFRSQEEGDLPHDLEAWGRREAAVIDSCF